MSQPSRPASVMTGRNGMFPFSRESLPAADPDNAKPARSSDPAVLGPLGAPGQGPFADFRAWQPG
jgi:hypothetical protein